MSIDLQGTDLNKFILVGDKILIKPKTSSNKTRSGLFLPPGVQENEKIHSGYVTKVGPGYPIPGNTDDEPWMGNENLKYIPLQPKEGDLAIYLQKSGFEIQYNREKYIIISHSSVLMLIRDETLFN
ncbi:MAG: co-chaperone GroES family protein [Flavobacteriales bacterium]|jgi:co-chaperonin GroES (HSP10)|nr:co-chaperone GroES family protein [Flavobacteriales bacterium]MDG1440748.1 co-chaperone GroES family protein [Flavobacteriales bacterium]MDG1798867.1 co-chaperone GroES family protein [Flavobacteriales bacterium]